MSRAIDADPAQHVGIKGWTGKQMAFALEFLGEEDSAIDLTGYTAFGKIVDEGNALILDLTPSIGAANGQYIVDILVPSNTVPGNYQWRGGLTDSGGTSTVWFEGPAYIQTY